MLTAAENLATAMANTQNVRAYSAAPELGLHGKWPAEVRMSGLQRLARACTGKTVLDLGTAEGLIALHFLQCGAAVVHGVDIVPERIIAAQQICRNFSSAKFWQADLSDWNVFWANHAGRMLPRYDIVLYLGIHHHLPAQSRMATLLNAALLSSEVIALRMPDSCHRGENVEGRLAVVGFSLVDERRNRTVRDLSPLRVFSRRAQAEVKP